MWGGSCSCPGERGWVTPSWRGGSGHIDTCAHGEDARGLPGFATGTDQGRGGQMAFEFLAYRKEDNFSERGDSISRTRLGEKHPKAKSIQSRKVENKEQFLNVCLI